MKKKVVLPLLLGLAAVSFTAAVACGKNSADKDYTVTVMNGDEVVSSTEVKKDGVYDLSAGLTVEGYVFEGYYLTADFSGEPVTSVTVTADTVIYVKLSPVVIEYTVSVMFGEEELHSEVVSANTTYTLPSFPITGYTFDGYYADEELSGTKLETVTVKEDTTVYACYIPNEYTVRYHPGRSVGAEFEQTFTYDVRRQLSDSPYSLRGETFVGWATEPEGEVVYVDGGYVKNLTAEKDGVIDLYACFDVEDYASFVVEGGVVLSYTGTASSVRLPYYATEIAEDAFANNTYLETVYVPDTYEKIGKGAFRGCSSLTKLTVPFIGESADSLQNNYLAYIFGADSWIDNKFEITTAVSGGSLYIRDFDTSSLYVPQTLKTVVVGGTPSEIGNGAFYSCYGLENVVIRDSSALVEIGAAAFASCPYLGYNTETKEHIKLDFFRNVRTIGMYAFMSYVSDGGKGYFLTNLRELGPMPEVTTISAQAFYGVLNLTDVPFGDKVQEIGDFAFSMCSGITEYTVTPSVKTIGRFAFADCSSLSTLTIDGGGNLEIGDYAFAECAALFQVTLNMDYFPKVGAVPFSNGLTSNDDGTYSPTFDKFRIYVNDSAMVNIINRTLPEYEGKVFVKTEPAQKAAYYYEVAGGYLVKFVFTDGWVMYVDDPTQEILSLYTMFGYIDESDVNKFGTYYPMLVEKLEDAETYPNAAVYEYSNPSIKSYDGVTTVTYILRVMLMPVEVDGEIKLLPVVALNGYNKSTEGSGAKPVEGSYVIKESVYGVVSVFQYRKNEEGELELLPVDAPEGTYFAVYEGSSYSSLHTVTYYNDSYEVIETQSYFKDSSDNLWLRDGSLDLVDAYISSYYRGTSDFLFLSGDGRAELRVDGTVYSGSYAVSGNAAVGGEGYEVSFIDMASDKGTFSFIGYLKNYYDGEYHRADFTLDGKEIVLLSYYGAERTTANNIIEKFWDYKADQAKKNTDAYYFATFARHTVNGGYILYVYRDKAGEIAASYVIDKATYEVGDLILTENGYKFVFRDGTLEASFIEGDMRGSFTVGDTEYLVYISEEDFNYYLYEYYYGYNIYYYMVKLDGYGNAYFRDMSDDGIDVEYFGTYYNTGKYVLTYEGVDYYEFTFTSEDGGAVYTFLPDLYYSYEGEYVIDPDGDLYDDKNYQSYEYSLLYAAFATAEPTVYTVCDDYNYKIAEIVVDAYGIATVKEYTYEFIDGSVVYTEKETDKKAVAYVDSSGNAVRFAIYDGEGYFLCFYEKDGEFFYREEDSVASDERTAKFVVVDESDYVALNKGEIA